MLCCDETADAPAQPSVQSRTQAVQAVFIGHQLASGQLQRRPVPVPTIALKSHGPPLYELFAAFLI